MEPDLVHILVESFSMVVKIGLDVQNEPLDVVWIAIKRADIEPAGLLRLGLLLPFSTLSGRVGVCGSPHLGKAHCLLLSQNLSARSLNRNRFLGLSLMGQD